MFPLNLIRKAGSLLRGSARPPQIIASVMLGTVAGFTAGANLWTVLFILAALVFNVNFFLFLAFWGVGEGIAFAVTPVTFNVGWVLLAVPPIAAVVRFLVNAPGTALLELERYVVLGGIPVALALGAGAGYLTSYLVQKLRRITEAAQQKSERWQRFKQRRVMRFLSWILFGKKVDPEDFSPRIIRRSGAIVLGVGVILIAAASIFVLPPAAEWGIETGLARVNGATVEVDEVDFAPFAGRMYLRGFQMANARDLDRNVWEFREMGASLNLAQLLRGRVVIDRAVVDRARLSARRETRAERWPTGKPPVEEKPAPEPPEEGEPLEKYLKEAEAIKKRIEQVQYYLDRLQSFRGKAERPTKEEAEQRADRWGYSNLTASYLVEDVPGFVLRDLQIRDMAVSENMSPLTCRMTGLSNNPRLLGAPLTAQVEQTDGAGYGRVELGYHKTVSSTNIRLTVRGIPAQKISGELAGDAPLDMQQGKLAVDCDGTMNAAGKVHLPFRITATGLKASAEEGERAGGVPAGLLARVLSSSDKISLTVVLDGPLRALRARVKMDELMAQLRQAAKEEARDAAEEKVLEMLEKQGGDKLPPDTRDRLRGLFGGGSEDREKDN